MDFSVLGTLGTILLYCLSTYLPTYLADMLLFRLEGCRRTLLLLFVVVVLCTEGGR